jgi:hypothetical protein
MIRVPVLSPDGKPLMPAKASRVRRWLKAGKAKVTHNDLGIFQVQLVNPPSGEETQDIVAGIDPGKLFTGIAIQSAKATLFLAHLNLPFKNVTKRMTQRVMMRRGRRGRRINRKVSFDQRNHRQHRFDNRKGHKIPPSIRANKQLALRVPKFNCCSEIPDWCQQLDCQTLLHRVALFDLYPPPGCLRATRTLFDRTKPESHEVKRWLS